MSSSPIYIKHPIIWDNSVEFRLYQKNIVESACLSNTLVILPTALGKTIISALVCADMLYKYRDKRVLIMAPTRPLVGQHLKLFSSVLKILEEQIVAITGKTLPETRRAIWCKKEVRLIFATPEIVKNDLNEGRLQLRDFSLLVFDEAHKAVKDYSYTLIAKEYINQSPCPMILALTASPGAERSRVQEVCNNLFIENLEYRNEDDPDVKPYVNPIQVKWEWFSLPEEYHYIASTLRSMLHEKLRWLIQRGILRRKSLEWVFKRDLISLGEELQYTIELTMEEQRAPLYIALMNQSSALTLMYCLELIESQGSFSLKAFLDRIEQEENEKTHSALLKQPGIMEIRAILQNMTNEGPKIQYLLQLMKHSRDYSQNRVSHSDKSKANYNNKDNNQKSKILIFTQYRDTAKHIVEILSRNKISCSRFVGQANRMGDDGMTQEKQAEVLESFREGDFQVLVATSIAEEGLDIPEVDLVVFYEPIPSEIRYIQRRGRTGRNSAGLVILLAMKDSIDVRYLNASTRRVEKMKESLASIKTTFRPLTREAQFKLNPMTADELITIEKRNKRVKDRLSETVRLAITQGLLPENEANERLNVLSRNRRMNSLSIETELLTDHFRKQVDKAARRIYLQLQKYGRGGTDVEALTDVLDIEDQVKIEAIKKLEKLRKVEWLDEGTIASTNWIYRLPLGKILNLHIEKVVQGKAVVMIDGKWRARLNHYDYEGPREFLKKGSKFKAIGELYHDDGVLSIKVKQIIGAT
ncbi:MAG TPA: helicase-related protein [Nitrososphaeraceae archaeon]|nr:helicase-related protein [Nitrososphaeraceae archaeon]